MARRLHLPHSLNELARYRAFPIALVVVVLIPLVYSAIYLGALWNPTGHLDNVPVALVDEDTGATTSSGGQLDAGRQVADTIKSSDTLQWHEVSASEASDGVQDGRYMASVTIPTTFSRALADTGNLSQAELQVRYDDANGYTTRTVVSSVVGKVHDAISQTLGTRVADQLFLGYTNIHDQLGQAHAGAATVAKGADTLSSGTVKLSSGAAQLASGAAMLTGKIDQAASGAATLATATGTVHSRTAQAATGAAALATGVQQLSAQMPQAQKAAGTIASGSSQISAKTSEAAGSAKKLAAAQSSASASAQQLSTGLSGAQTSLKKAAGASDELSKGAGQLSTGLSAGMSDEQKAQIAKLTATLSPQQQQAFQTIMGTVQSQQTQAASSAKKLASGADQLSIQLDKAPGQLSTASAGASSLAAGERTIASGQTRLSTGLTTLAGTQAQLAGGAQTLSTSMASAVAGTAKLSTNETTLAKGLGRLSAGTATLDTSTKKLSSGLGRLSSGSGTFAGSSKQLASGMSTAAGASKQVAAGTGKVASGLSSAQDKVPSYSKDAASRNATAAQSPVKLTQSWFHEATNNGEGFAPYFIGLSLFVGGIMLWMLLRPINSRHLLTTARAHLVVAGQWVPGTLLAVAGSVTLIAVLHWVMGMHVGHLLATFGITALAAAAFISLQQALIILLAPGPGRFACIVLLALQLGSAGGSYPVATAPGFFRTVSPWLPMTHVVTALRESLTGSIGGGYWSAVIFLAVVLVVSVAASVAGARHSRTWTITALHPALKIGG